jgi:hypothetical protein
MKAKDLTGQVFGRLTVLGRADHPRRRWLCQCSCGNQSIIRAYNRGRIQSCGCLRKENGKNWRRSTGYADQIKNRILHILENGPKDCLSVKAEFKAGYVYYLRQLIKDGQVTKTGTRRGVVYFPSHSG